MEGYQAQDSEYDTFKYYAKRYFKLFLIVIVGFVLVSTVILYFQKRSFTHAAQASDLYQTMLTAQAKADKQKLVESGETLIAEYVKTPYAQFAALLLAKNAVDDSDFVNAEKYLRWSLDAYSAKDLTWHVANLRLVNILLEQDKFDEASKLLSIEVDKAYLGLYEEARGDVYLAQNDLEKAKESYMKAVQNLAPGEQAPILQMKLQDLGVAADA